jgi:hypothetical protein
MMLSDTVVAIDAMADLLGAVEQRLPAVDPGARAFGAGGAGLLGELGRDAYLVWQVGLDARVQEARAHGPRVRDLAQLVAEATGGLADADHAAGQGHRRPDGGVGGGS